MKTFDSFAQFYPYYLSQHANAVCRTLHFVGLSLSMGLLAFALATQQWWVLVAIPLVGYGFSWAGHFGFEKNKPASFGHPLWSFAGDWVMYWQMLTGKVPFSGRLAAA